MIRTIIAVRNVNGLDLLSARELIEVDDAGPHFVLKGVTLDLAEAAVIRLEQSDVGVEIVPHTSAHGYIPNARIVPGAEFLIWVRARQRVQEAFASLHKAQEDVEKGLISVAAIAEQEGILRKREIEERTIYINWTQGH